MSDFRDIALTNLLNSHTECLQELLVRLTAIEAKLAKREKAEQALDEQPCSHGEYENCRICNNDE